LDASRADYLEVAGRAATVPFGAEAILDAAVLGRGVCGAVLGGPALAVRGQRGGDGDAPARRPLALVSTGDERAVVPAAAPVGAGAERLRARAGQSVRVRGGGHQVVLPVGARERVVGRGGWS